MKRTVVYAALFAATFGYCSAVSAAAALSTSVTRIPSLIAPEGINILRIQVQPAFIDNPAACDLVDVVDLQLDVPGRSVEEQRQMLNAINLAFMTGRTVKFYLRDDLCSTVGTSSRLRVVVGVQVLY